MSNIPEGYMQNGQGHLVPVEQVKEIDRDRDDLVREIFAKARAQEQALSELKQSMADDVAAFIELSAERYDIQIGGKKGNATLMSFDGKLKLMRSNQDQIVFDESLKAAKAIIDELIHAWTAGSNTELRTLVDHAFQTDSEGKISTTRVMGLLKLEITDGRWLKAMEAIRDSVKVVGSKTYFRLYERIGDSENFRQISLDLASA